MKRLDLYTYIYNDEDILPFFLDHYSFVDRMTFIDSGSNDKTEKMLYDFSKKWDGEVRICQTGLKTWDHEILHYYKNHIWKESEYDLIVFPDADEFLYATNGINNYLQTTKYDVYECEGFEMISKHFPKPGTKITEIKTGLRFHPFNKTLVWSPKIEIELLNAHLRYTRCTNVDMTGNIKLLHYRSLGPDMVVKRHRRSVQRTPKNYKHYRPESEQFILKRYDNWLKEATEVI